MQDASVDLWATDEVHFQQHGSRCRMWIPPEIKDPVLLHAPTRKCVGYFGAVRLRDGRFVFSLETANLMGPASFSFSSNFAPPVVGPGDGLWSLPTTPLITTRDSTNRGGKSTPTVLSWTSFPLTVPNSTRSNECGSSHAVAACIIATSKILRTLSALSKRNLHIGHVATMCYADYAQLLKTLCLDRE